MKWAGEHPGLLAAALFLGVGFIGAYPLPAVLILTVLGVGVGLVRWMVWLGKRSRGEVERRRALIARADYEHWLILNGDDRGTFGQYPPAV